MRSNYIRSKSETKQVSRAAAKEEIKRQMETFCPKCQARMERQTIAVLLTALHNVYGFGGKRLRQVYECACGLGEYVHQNGDAYDDFVADVRDKYGIDLEKED